LRVHEAKEADVLDVEAYDVLDAANPDLAETELGLEMMWPDPAPSAEVNNYQAGRDVGRLRKPYKLE
jgi:hypothetical protein